MHTPLLLTATTSAAAGLCDADLSCVVSSDTTDGTECTPVPNTSGRCICSPGPLPQYAFCELADAEYGSFGTSVMSVLCPTVQEDSSNLCCAKLFMECLCSCRKCPLCKRPGM